MNWYGINFYLTALPGENVTGVIRFTLNLRNPRPRNQTHAKLRLLTWLNGKLNFNLHKGNCPDIFISDYIKHKKLCYLSRI